MPDRLFKHFIIVSFIPALERNTSALIEFFIGSRSGAYLPATVMPSIRSVGAFVE